MKQKNLILIVIAAGCGLAAAFLTSQMSGKPKVQEQEFKEVIVASKELKPGDKFTKDSLKDQVKRRKYKPEEVPPTAVTEEGDLVDKQLTKTLRADDYVSLGDLGTYKPLDLPVGYDLISIRTPVDKVTPFIKPGSRLDIIGTGITRSGKVVGLMILPNVLTMAVDVETKAAGDGPNGRVNIQLTSFAVTTEQAILMRMVETANVQLSCILRSEDAGERDSSKGWSKDAVVKWLQDQQENVLPTPREGEKPTSQGGPTAPATPTTIKLPVPTEDLPAGTEITAELLQAKFKDGEFVPPAPEHAVTNMKEHVGRYLVEKVTASAFVPRSSIGSKPEPKKPDVKPAPDTTPEPKLVVAPTPEKPKKKVESFVRSFTNATGTRYFRFEKEEGGEWKQVGEVKEDGTPMNGAPPSAPSAGVTNPTPPAAGGATGEKG